jgi:hypothetical protein
VQQVRELNGVAILFLVLFPYLFIFCFKLSPGSSVHVLITVGGGEGGKEGVPDDWG